VKVEQERRRARQSEDAIRTRSSIQGAAAKYTHEGSLFFFSPFSPLSFFETLSFAALAWRGRRVEEAVRGARRRETESQAAKNHVEAKSSVREGEPDSVGRRGRCKQPESRVPKRARSPGHGFGPGEARRLRLRRNVLLLTIVEVARGLDAVFEGLVSEVSISCPVTRRKPNQMIQMIKNPPS
jgi:hypothetical protein